MTIRQSKPFEPQPICLIVLIVLASATGCMLQDFDKLGPGNGRVGGAAGRGGGGKPSGGTTATATEEGGTTGSSGEAGQPSGNGGSAGMPPVSGGSGGKSSTNGGSAGTSTTNGGATTSSAGAAGAAGEPVIDPRCPGYTATSGRLLTPPSADFETEGTWTTVTSQACTRTASSGSTDGCQGGYYLTCNIRKIASDGPKFTVSAGNVFAGHRYYVTALARYSPATAPAEVSPLVVLASYRCLSSTQLNVPLGTTQYTTSDWVRVGGLLPAITCDASSLDSLYFAVQTNTPKPAPAYYEPVDVDDFRVYDLD